VKARSPIRARAPLVEEAANTSLLDLVDNLLNRGVVLDGEVVLGVANVDLVYLRLSALLCAADRVLPRTDTRSRARRRSSLDGIRIVRRHLRSAREADGARRSDGRRPRRANGSGG
jgi:gas vesicle protein GvpA/GvpJ/GvpM family